MIVVFSIDKWYGKRKKKRISRDRRMTNARFSLANQFYFEAITTTNSRNFFHRYTERVSCEIFFKNHTKKPEPVSFTKKKNRTSSGSIQRSENPRTRRGRRRIIFQVRQKKTIIISNNTENDAKILPAKNDTTREKKPASRRILFFLFRLYTNGRFSARKRPRDNLGDWTKERVGKKGNQKKLKGAERSKIFILFNRISRCATRTHSHRRDLSKTERARSA